MGGADEAPCYSEQWEAEADEVKLETTGQLCFSPSEAPAGVAGEDSSDPAPAGQPLGGATALVAAEHSTVESSAAGQLGAAAAVQDDDYSPQLQPCAECIQPAVSTTDSTADGRPSGMEASGCPVVQRLGSRGSSFTGEHAPLEAGIAVPVAGSAVGAVGAELLAAGSMRASVDSRGAAASLERRDTPPQHIAARHQQVAAAARREVEAVLAKRGLRLDGQ